MASSAVPDGPPNSAVQAAITAYDRGFWIVAGLLNAEMKRAGVRVQIAAKPPASPHTNLRDEREAFKDNWRDIRGFARRLAPDGKLPPDDRLRLWTFGHLKGKQQLPIVVGLFDQIFGDLQRLIRQYSDKHAAGWTADDWRENVKAPVESLDAEWRQRLELLRSAADTKPAVGPPVDVDKVAYAIALLLTLGPNKAAIAREIQVHRNTMVGKKWAVFNSRLDQARRKKRSISG